MATLTPCFQPKCHVTSELAAAFMWILRAWQIPVASTCNELAILVRSTWTWRWQRDCNGYLVWKRVKVAISSPTEQALPPDIWMTPREQYLDMFLFLHCNRLPLSGILYRLQQECKIAWIICEKRFLSFLDCFNVTRGAGSVMTGPQICQKACHRVCQIHPEHDPTQLKPRVCWVKVSLSGRECPVSPARLWTLWLK